ncbi:MAG: hypothetical protein ACMVY4_04110 [Minwuia sp.]|uniref:hypothetical protein n=1 Tax=Minwuia sp. TaxID=2493630 RepID=UPI003A840C63
MLAPCDANGETAMRCLIVLLACLAALPALAFSPEPIHPSASQIARALSEMPAFRGMGIREKQPPGLDGYSQMVIGDDEDQSTLSATLLVRDKALVGLRFDIPLLPKADPGLYALTEIAGEIEPAMKDLALSGDLARRDALKGWASEIGIESWMRPRYGAYRVERRVGDTLFVFEGQPLQAFWVGISHAGNAHPVLDDYAPFMTGKEMKEAKPVLEAVERGEYAQVRRLVTPLAQAAGPGPSWCWRITASRSDRAAPCRPRSTACWRNRPMAASRPPSTSSASPIRTSPSGV